MSDTQVLIVGAGPVGLTLAIDLGQRGIRCTLIERKDKPAFLPKMERINARTMEIYRRMGLSKKIRAAGLRRDIPMDVYIVLNLTRPPLLRLPYPSVAEAEADIRATYDGSVPLEPYQLISQYTLEPLLKAEGETLPSVTMHWSTEYVSHEETADGVSVTVRSADGKTRTISCDYLAGCDGGTSAVRQALGIRLRGEANLLAASPGALSLRRAVRQNSDRQRPGTRPPLSRGRAERELPADAGLDEALDPACDRRHRRGGRSPVREDRRHSGEVRDGCPPIRGGRTCCSPSSTGKAACSSPAMRCISSSRPAGSA